MHPEAQAFLSCKSTTWKSPHHAQTGSQHAGHSAAFPRRCRCHLLNPPHDHVSSVGKRQRPRGHQLPSRPGIPVSWTEAASPLSSYRRPGHHSAQDKEESNGGPQSAALGHTLGETSLSLLQHLALLLLHAALLEDLYVNRRQTFLFFFLNYPLKTSATVQYHALRGYS